MNRKLLLGVVVAVVLLGGVGVTFATTGTPNPDLSEEEAKQIAGDHANGTAESITLEQENGPAYEGIVEQDDGDRKEVEVDGNSGDVLEVEKADGAENEDGSGDGDAK